MLKFVWQFNEDIRDFIKVKSAHFHEILIKTATNKLRKLYAVQDQLFTAIIGTRLVLNKWKFQVTESYVLI